MKIVALCLLIVFFHCDIKCQLITVDTSWVNVEYEYIQHHLDTCHERIIEIDKSKFENLTDKNGYLEFEKYGFSHIISNNDFTHNVMSVYDSIMLCYYKNSNLGSKVIYSKGVLIKDTSYGINGELISEFFLDTIERIKTEHYYEKGVLQKTFVHRGKQSISENWYPNNNLKVSKGELNGIIDLTQNYFFQEEINLSTRFADAQIKLTYGNNMDIIMKIGSEKKVLSSGITINLKKDTPVVLEIRLAHDGQNFMNFDTLQIIGNDSEINIPISLTGSHVSYQKLNEGTPIHISRIKDRKIIIAQIGTETSISFRGKKINSDLNVSYRGSYIDISDIPNGDFNLLIGSCHISGTLPVTIGE